MFDTPPVFETPTPRPLGFIVTVKPRDPKKSVGLLATAKRTQEAEQTLETIGQILAIGEKAWTADFNLSVLPKVGDWVVYRQHAGQRMKLQPAAGDGSDTLIKFVLLLTDTDILARFDSFADAAKFYSWI